MNKHVLMEIDPRGVATVTLNRPEKHNAFDEQLIAALTAAFNAVAGDDAARIMVLRAKGKNFCAGADVDWMRRMAGFSYEENLADARALADMLETLNFLPVPTIARVHGAALGGGAGLVCCCDMAVAETGASFAFSEARLGIIPATISPYVARAIGLRAARRYCLTAERFDAQQARALGLVNDVVPEAGLDESVGKIVSEILKNGPEAVRAAKRMIFEAAERELNDELLRETCERIATVRATGEAREGLSAFLEKRSPSWTVNR